MIQPSFTRKKTVQDTTVVNFSIFVRNQTDNNLLAAWEPLRGFLEADRPDWLDV